jgi:hypothetical protein
MKNVIGTVSLNKVKPNKNKNKFSNNLYLVFIQEAKYTSIIYFSLLVVVPKI